MSYDVYWVKNRAEKIADFEHPRLKVCFGQPKTARIRCSWTKSGSLLKKIVSLRQNL